MVKQQYTPSVQNPTDPNAGRRTALPMAVAPITQVKTKSDCRGSLHQLRGFRFHEGRRSSSVFQRRRECEAFMTANIGMTSRMIKHRTASGLVRLSLSGVIEM